MSGHAFTQIAVEDSLHRGAVALINQKTRKMRTADQGRVARIRKRTLIAAANADDLIEPTAHLAGALGAA